MVSRGGRGRAKERAARLDSRLVRLLGGGGFGLLGFPEGRHPQRLMATAAPRDSGVWWQQRQQRQRSGSSRGAGQARMMRCRGEESPQPEERALRLGPIAPSTERRPFFPLLGRNPGRNVGFAFRLRWVGGVGWLVLAAPLLWVNSKSC